jgi:hypothetical protein
MPWIVGQLAYNYLQGNGFQLPQYTRMTLYATVFYFLLVRSAISDPTPRRRAAASDLTFTNGLISINKF